MIVHPDHNYFVLPTDDAAEAKGYKYYPNGANQFKKFCNLLTIQSDDFHGEAGRKLELLPWQETLANTMLGWRDKEGRYRFKEIYTYAPRRVGKTVLCSTLASFFAWKDKRTDVLLLAGSIEQSKLAFKRIEDFITNNELLNNLFWCRDHIKTIEGENGSNIKIMSSVNKNAKGGRSVSFMIFDEMAEWQRSTEREIWDKLYDSTSDKKLGGMIFSITSPQYDLSSLSYEKFMLCKKVLSGEENRTDILPVIYQAPDNWKDIPIEDAITIANPSLNKTVSIKYYLDQWENIKDNPLETIRFENQNLGRWTGAPTSWIPDNVITKNIYNFNESELYKSDCIIGVDYGASYDLTCMTAVIKKDNLYYLIPYYFIPQDIAYQRQQKDNVPYLGWASNPKYNLTLTPGDVVDSNYMITLVKSLVSKYKVKQIRYDKTRLEGFRQMIMKECPYIEMVSVSTSPQTMSPAFRMLERCMNEGSIRMTENPISRWCFGNCVPHIDKHEKLMVERSGDANKIDFIDAAAIGLTYWLDSKNDVLSPPPGNNWAIVV